MATSKHNGAAAVTDDGHDEVSVEPIRVDAETLKRAVENKAQRDRLKSQESGNGDEQKKFTKNRRISSSNGTPGDCVHDRRSSYSNNRYKSNSKSKQSFDEAGPRAGTKPRSTSTIQSQDSVVSTDEKKRTRSSNTNGKSRNKSYSVNSNGESFDYDDFELEEPFSDSDEETLHETYQKPSLIIPRGRIRTLSGTVPPIGYSPKWGGPTMCMSCLQFFDLPELIEKFSDHLLTEHQIVIDEVELIVDPKRYVEYWRQRLAKQSIVEIFPKVVPKEGDELFGVVDYYFEMSARITEDYSLRQRLAMRRLEEALSCQQREREDTSFTLPCIFCRYVARGNRSKIIHHLYMIHHLNLGSPDNLVFVQEYIEHLRERMLRNECIYCEKTFADRNTLMEHMRKRNHREVNPNNNYYDKFYIINYLELGKRWLDVLAEDYEDKHLPANTADSDDEEEEESWNEWQMDNEDELRVVCLFCNNHQGTAVDLLDHMNEKHKFDFVQYIRDNSLGTYERAKFINHLRRKTYNTPSPRKEDKDSPSPAELPARAEWDTEEELVPIFGNDHFVWMLESLLEEQVNVQSKEDTGSEKENDGEVEGTAKIDPKQRWIAECRENTVDGVVAEDLPDISESVLAKDDLYKTVC